MQWFAIAACTLSLPFLANVLAVDTYYNQRVLAFYYVWYGDPKTDGQYKHWNHEVLPHWNAQQKNKFPHGARFDPPENVHSPFYPAKGPYSSSDVSIIRQHAAEMIKANITVMVISWWGPEWRTGSHDTQGVNTDQVLGTIVAELEQQDDLKVAFHLEPYEGRTTETVRADIVYLMSRFNSSKALLRQDGRPVYFVYDSYRIAPADWAHLLTPQGQATVRGTDWDGVFIGLILEGQDCEAIKAGGFDGMYTYFASEVVSYASKPDHWQQLARWAEANSKLFVVSLGPGYDDSKIRPWNVAATRPREGGARYRRQWEAAQASGAPLVSITSFNEWGEGTQIEPAQPWTDARSDTAYQDYGGPAEGGPNLYLDITRECAGQFIEARQAEQRMQQQSKEEL